MAEPYYPLYFNWIEDTQELNDQEKGRLIDAIVLYARGDDWKDRIKGNERYVFPIYQNQLERARRLSAVRAEAGAKGGIQTQASASRRKQTEANTSNLKQTEASSSKRNNNKNNNKEEYIEDEEEKRAREETPTYGSGLGSMLTDEDLQRGMEEQQAVDRIRATWEECGCRFSDRDEKTMHELLEKHTEEQIIKAVESAHDHNARGNWGYIKAVLEGGNKGGRTGGTAQSRGCAPRYTNGTGELPDWYPERI